MLFYFLPWNKDWEKKKFRLREIEFTCTMELLTRGLNIYCEIKQIWFNHLGFSKHIHCLYEVCENKNTQTMEKNVLLFILRFITSKSCNAQFGIDNK